MNVRQLIRDKVEEYAITYIAVSPKAIAKTVNTDFKRLYQGKMLELLTEKQMTKMLPALKLGV